MHQLRMCHVVNLEAPLQRARADVQLRCDHLKGGMSAGQHFHNNVAYLADGYVGFVHRCNPFDTVYFLIPTLLLLFADGNTCHSTPHDIPEAGVKRICLA